ncbi:hypothetical protein [Methylotuvimicrobium buryatense]|uniref:Uncharacterized protein n=1 Tax=Methylotuvimicrobium buryatense TaxID=95641 RepID=A0A4P9UVB0_METBY|nr:hypothetical protein [Methylotuvimicrobium buryatense]QCW84371.1 hypothetical protein EQU24_20645 [Methylotuvimicrobium buryatense]
MDHPFLFALRNRTINSNFRDIKTALLDDAEISRNLVELSKSFDEAVLFDLLHIASIPANAFQVNPESKPIRLNELGSAAAELQRQLSMTDPNLLQRYADKATNFGKTARFYRADILKNELLGLLVIMSEICDQDATGAGAYANKKTLSNQSRARALVKARLLKEKTLLLLKKPHHSLVAALANVSEQPDEPLTTRDVMNLQ